MDLIKIGKYIAEKRKNLGLTQKQVAEQLGMSDKSVSKWERGICLPDVSVYMELCKILEISINEFLAGEDISEENMIRKSEDNLLQVAKDSKHRLKNMKVVIAALCVITLAALVTLGSTGFRILQQPKNYMEPVARDSAEMKTAELLAGVDGACMFRYLTKDGFSSVTVYLSEYHEGKMVKKEKLGDLAYEGMNTAGEGRIVLVPDFEKFTIRLILADDSSRVATEFPILEDEKDRAYYGRTISQMEEKRPIQYNTQQGLVAVSCGRDGVSQIPVQDVERGEVFPENAYVYYLAVQFNRYYKNKGAFFVKCSFCYLCCGCMRNRREKCNFGKFLQLFLQGQ